LREGSTESLAGGRPYKNDVSVRISAVPAFLHEMQALLAREYPQIEVVWFGHIGDGNLHINVLRPDDLAEETFIAQCEHVTKLLTRADHGPPAGIGRSRGRDGLVALRTGTVAPEIARPFTKSI